MEKFMTLLQEKLTPIANFCGTERHFASMQKGFMSAISFILVSAVFMILANPPVTADLVAQGGFWSVFGPWLDFATANKLTLLIPFNMTMGILSVIVTFAIAYNLAGTYKMPKLNAGMTSLVMFLIAAAPSSYYQLADESVLQAVPCTYLGAQGLFTAIIVALVSVEVTRFCQTKGITIKMPDGVPPFLSETFGAIVPMLANILIFFGGNLLIQMIDPALSIPSVIEKLLAAPLSVAVDSVPGALLICFMTLLFWCFGVHGNMIVMPITAPVTLAAAFGEGPAVRNPLSLVPAIIARPRAFGESTIRRDMPPGLVEGIDRMDSAGRRRTLRSIGRASESSGFEAACEAALRVVEGGRVPDDATVDVLARRIAGGGGGAGGADLSVYDGFLKGAVADGS